MWETLLPIINGQELNATSFKEVISPFNKQVLEKLYYLESFSNDSFIHKQSLKNESLSISDISKKLAIELEKDRELILEKVTLETGSPIKYHLGNLKTIETFLSDIENYIKSSWDNDFHIEPKGKVLIIMPANEPLILSIIPVVTALFLGNTVLLKPSSKTPFFSFYLTKKLLELGLPSGLLSYIPAEKEAINSLLEKGLVDSVLSFASSKNNGRLGSVADLNNIEINVENEGNDWVYVDKNHNYNLQELAEILANGIMKHNGQMCDSIRGLLIHEDIFEDTTKVLMNLIRDAKCGNPLDMDTDVGSLLEGTDQSVRTFIEQNAKKFEHIFNYSAEDVFIKPTLLFISNNEVLSLFKEPLYAPVTWVKKVTGLSEVVDLYKKYNKHGLSFSIFTSDESLINQATRDIKTGTVNINYDPVNPQIESPWGGVGLSGRGGPLYWADRFVNRKVVKNE